MENGSSAKWVFEETAEPQSAMPRTIREVIDKVISAVGTDEGKVNQRPVIHLGHGDPSACPSFRTTAVADDAIFDAVRSARFNGYSPAVGIQPARRSVAEYLSRDLPYKLTDDDVFLTVGANHAIEIILTALARPGSNVLLPRPGYPLYEARAAFSNIEVRHFDLLPEEGWEVNLDAVEALADNKTMAIVIINPGNPCGNVFTYEHLQKIAQTARKLGILVVADEVYYRLTFGKNPFVPMGIFGSVAPVLTIGTLSKRWIIPGWRLGWIAINDPNGILWKSGVADSIKNYINLTADPATIIQAAVPQILEKTDDSFYQKVVQALGKAADVCHNGLMEIPCIACPYKPEGGMFTMMKLNLPLLVDIDDDMEFCTKLAKEESLILLPGVAVGMKNWLRISFAAETDTIEDAVGRMKQFSSRHSKRSQG